jgi:Zn-dependent protease
MLWSLAETYYPDVSPLPLDRSASWFMALGTIPLLFFCITLHELAHAMTARRYDISVHYIVLMLFGGTARYAREAPSPKAELYIAAAGPIMSMSLAIGFALLNQSTPTEPVQAAMLFLLIANTGLATFNLFPCFPMDGGRLLHAFLWHVTKDHARATKWSITVGRAFATSLISIGLFIWLTTNAATGIWIAFLGAFLYNAATAAGPSHDMA